MRAFSSSAKIQGMASSKGVRAEGLRELAFIDTSLADWSCLRGNLPGGVESVLINACDDGLAIMAATMASRHDIDAIHIFSHGFPGGFHLGATIVDKAALADRGADFAVIGAGLSMAGDILIYSCNVAVGAGGDFLEMLADRTGANIQASSTLTGAAGLGGNWELDWRHGPVGTTAMRIEAYPAVMSQPSYSSTNGYISENFFTIVFDQDLDATNPPPTNAFSVAVNGTGVTVTGVTVNSTAKTVVVSISTTLLAGDIIEFAYTDPTSGDDANAIQDVATGSDALTSSHTAIVFTTRPGPSQPVITSATSTNDSTPVISGTADAGVTITLTIGGATFTTTATGGNWSIDTGTATPASGTFSPNANGTNAVSVKATDGSSNDSTAATQTLTIDTTAPGAPVITSATATNDGTPTITGTAEAGSTVTLTIGGATYTTTATGGNWSIDTGSATPTSGSFSPITNGTNAVSATAADAVGNVSTAGTQTLTIDTIAPGAPVITSAA
ncbi:DUF4347 domain-containing protein, partial [Niveispirillum sp.]|uniref:DUF4347 domain-containing protein n=1 Tax=Niveispirillum sp. TaxID=1917217 RepID=UPI001B5CF18B